MPNGASPRATSASAARTLSARRHMRLDRLPHAEALERRLAVDAGRHVVGIAHGQTAAVERAGKIEAGLDLDRGLAVRGATRTRPLPSRSVRLPSRIRPRSSR